MAEVGSCGTSGDYELRLLDQQERSSVGPRPRPSSDMGALYRSEEMCLAQLFLQSEAAYTCVAELGELGLVQFRDLNPDVSPFQRKFVNEVRRCDEMERKLRFLEKEMRKDGIPMLDTFESPDAPQPREMIDMEATFEKLENELREVNQNEETLKNNFAELTELKHILKKTQVFFDEVSGAVGRRHMHGQGNSSDDEERAALSTAIHDQDPTRDAVLHLGFVAGVIVRERLPAFERLLWRVCRGNVFLRTAEIDDVIHDATTGEVVNKCVFIIFFQGDQLKQRVKKICEGFRATLYPCPDTKKERRDMSISVMTRIEDLRTVLGQTQDHRHRVLVAAAKNLKMWQTKVRKFKAIYHTLNYFNIDVTQKCLIAECWCPTAEMDRIRMALKRGSDESGSTVPPILNRMETAEAPPTYNKTNKYTRVFQDIVDAYGVANYQEINPAPWSIISFPMLFAMMFGDAGHGTIVLLAALYLCLSEKRLEAARIRDEIFQIIFSGRYLILLMGAFSIYTGIIYNDFFSKAANVFGSAWLNPFSERELPGDPKLMEKQLMFPPERSYDEAGGPYPFGVDPAWNLAEGNRLTFLNSLKMKTAVIFGVAQMTFGLLLSYENHKFFKSDLDIKFVFIPQLVFLTSIFIYLCLQIVAKWLFFSVKADYVLGRDYPGSSCAPSILIGLINMFMMKARHDTYINPDTKTAYPDCYLSTWYPGQSVAETVLVVLAAVQIPIMLGIKPYILWRRNKHPPRAPAHVAYQAMRPDTVRADMNGTDSEVEVVHHDQQPKPRSGGHGGHDDGPFNLGDTIVYQAIHTIEFALGCVSHTASYLRLWALSLAHAQLSEVLWGMVLSKAFLLDGYLGAFGLYVLFFFFGSMSVGILVFMEGLSAFLHALRLHWVEFQSKFYLGTGYAFLPFSFEKMLQEERDAEEP